MQQISLLLIFLNQPYMFRAKNSPILRSTFLNVYTAFGTIHGHCCRSAEEEEGKKKGREGQGEGGEEEKRKGRRRIRISRYSLSPPSSSSFSSPSPSTWHQSAAVSVHCTKSCIYSQKVPLRMGESVARNM